MQPTMLLIVAIAASASTLFIVLIIQNATSRERKVDYQISPCSTGDPTFRRCMDHLLGPPLVGGNSIRSLINGDEIFPAMMQAIRSAESSITFETYIYWSGDIGRAFSELLAERAAAGVRVHVLLDWLGSAKLDANALQKMKNAGVHVEKYRPLRWYNLSRVNSRTHRKILVVDGRVGFIGGVGIADQWQGNAEGPEHWRDSHFQVEGPAVAHLQAAFLDNWLKTRHEVLNEDAFFPELKSAGDALAQVFKSSPREGSGSVRLMFLMSIAVAKRQILIANSYFVPDDGCVDALVAARKGNVEIAVIVPGHHTDTAVTRRASRSRWGKLLEAGVKIYEFQPTMYHCKVMVVDECWTTVGSTNFDNRSFRLNDEANLNVLNEAFAKNQIRVFSDDLKRSSEVSLADWRNRPRLEKIADFLAGLFRSQV
ncbi:MAG: phospholipase D-like domain-containing protein [Planctomycetota bacterium]|nr:phospholipase D-like domain-containing protein [Planctomycetota bacterium]